MSEPGVQKKKKKMQILHLICSANSKLAQLIALVYMYLLHFVACRFTISHFLMNFTSTITTAVYLGTSL